MKLRRLILPIASILLAANAMAYPRHDPNVVDGGNLWSITFHNDDSTAHSQWATQRICFLPYTLPAAGQTQLKGVWYSTTYPNWHGHYRQEGDSVKMVGNFWQGRGNDGMAWDIVTSAYNTGLGARHGTIGAGHWSEWGDDGRFGPVYGFGNAIFERVGKCRSFTSIDDITAKLSSGEAQISDLEISVQPRVLKDGSEATHPMQEGQMPLEEANEYETLY